MVVSMSCMVCSYIGSLIYDARRNQGRIKNSRHQFHEQHFKKLLFVLSLTSLTGVLVFIRFTGFPMWTAAGVLAGFALIHILLVSSPVFSRKFWLQKEVQIALIYSVGIWLGALHYKEKPFDIQTFMVLLGFTLLAWWETSFVAFYEMETDLKQQNISLASRLGDQKTKKLLLLLLVLQLVFSSVQLLLFEGSIDNANLILLTHGFSFRFFVSISEKSFQSRAFAFCWRIGLLSSGFGFSYLRNKQHTPHIG